MSNNEYNKTYGSHSYLTFSEPVQILSSFVDAKSLNKRLRRYKNDKLIDDESVGRPTTLITSRHVMAIYVDSSVAT